MDLFRSSAVQEFCSSLHVPKLANDYNLPLALASCAFFFLVQAFSSRISPRLFPNHFAKFSGKTKLDWDFHAVRLTSLLALRNHGKLQQRADPTPSRSRTRLVGSTRSSSLR